MNVSIRIDEKDRRVTIRGPRDDVLAVLEVAVSRGIITGRKSTDESRGDICRLLAILADGPRPKIEALEDAGFGSSRRGGRVWDQARDRGLIDTSKSPTEITAAGQAFLEEAESDL